MNLSFHFLSAKRIYGKACFEAGHNLCHLVFRHAETDKKFVHAHDYKQRLALFYFFADFEIANNEKFPAMGDVMDASRIMRSTVSTSRRAVSREERATSSSPRSTWVLKSTRVVFFRLHLPGWMPAESRSWFLKPMRPVW